MPPVDVPATGAVPHAPAKPRGYVELGYVFAGVGALLFSTKAIAIKLAYAEGLDAETLLALRLGLSLPIFLVIGIFSFAENRRKGTLPARGLVLMAVALGLFGQWLSAYADFEGLEYISAQFERLILFTYPLFVVLFGAAFLRQPMRPQALAAVSVSYVGLAVIFTSKLTEAGPQAAIGAGWVLVSAVAFAFYLLLAKPVIAVMGPRLFTCIAMATAGVAAFVHFLLTHNLASFAISPRAFWTALYLAIGATVIPAFFFNAALHRISAQANATIGTLSPVVTILLAVAVLGETLTGPDVVGTLIVLAAVGWFTLADRR